MLQDYFVKIYLYSKGAVPDIWVRDGINLGHLPLVVKVSVLDMLDKPVLSKQYSLTKCIFNFSEFFFTFLSEITIYFIVVISEID